MLEKLSNQIETAELVLPCADLDATLGFFTGLGFQVRSVFPADDPAQVVVAGYGLRLRLVKGKDPDETVRLRFNCKLAEDLAAGLTAPNGVRIEIAAADPPVVLPELKPGFGLTKYSEKANWIRGRAGMLYRDLIPDRLGGRFIASHIHIPEGGPVPDYVHFHKIRFQMIHCRKGWAKLVYEDQGEPFFLSIGDTVLQPPRIRHRVLECSDDLEVIEVSSPADHETRADPETELPTERFAPQRLFEGQRFVRSIGSEGVWGDWRIEGFRCRDTGIGAATNGLAAVRVIRPGGDATGDFYRHDAEFVFFFVLQGGVTLRRLESKTDRLSSGDAVTIPAGMDYGLTDPSEGFELLEVVVEK